MKIMADTLHTLPGQMLEKKNVALCDHFDLKPLGNGPTLLQ